MLEVTVELDNRAKNHRLRLMVPSGIAAAEKSYAEGQFDVLERDIRLPDAEGFKEPPYPTHPMWNFCGTSDGEHGLAVLNDGLTEYEVVDDADRTIAVTLLRTFGTFVFGRPTPDSQCLGTHTYRFAILPAPRWMGRLAHRGADPQLHLPRPGARKRADKGRRNRTFAGCSPSPTRASCSPPSSAARTARASCCACGTRSRRR